MVCTPSCDTQQPCLQVRSLWENCSSGERLLSGSRLFPLPQTPWARLLAHGASAQQLLLLSDETHTIAVDRVSKQHTLLRAETPGEVGAAAEAALRTRADAVLIIAQATPGGFDLYAP